MAQTAVAVNNDGRPTTDDRPRNGLVYIFHPRLSVFVRVPLLMTDDRRPTTGALVNGVGGD